MSDVTIPAGDARLRGYLAIPDGVGPWPGVVVVHDVLGMTADLRRITDRFAASGYLAIAPSLDDVPARKTSWATGHFLTRLSGHGLSYDNLLAVREYLISDSRCRGRVGLAGFCTAAGVCLQLAPGGLFGPPAPTSAILPKGIGKLDQSSSGIGSFGATKPAAARGNAEKLEVLRGIAPRDMRMSPRAGHSFMNDHPLPAPIRLVAGIAGIADFAPEADEAWQRIIAFFADHLGAADRDPDALDRI